MASAKTIFYADLFKQYFIHPIIPWQRGLQLGNALIQSSLEKTDFGFNSVLKSMKKWNLNGTGMRFHWRLKNENAFSMDMVALVVRFVYSVKHGIVHICMNISQQN